MEAVGLELVLGRSAKPAFASAIRSSPVEVDDPVGPAGLDKGETVGAVASLEHVLAAASAEEVVPAPAIEPVVTAPAQQRIGPLAAAERILALIPTIRGRSNSLSASLRSRIVWASSLSVLMSTELREVEEHQFIAPKPSDLPPASPLSTSPAAGASIYARTATTNRRGKRSMTLPSTSGG